MESGTVIKELRERAGLTQEELADRALTSQPTIAAYEADRSEPRIETLGRIAQACGFELNLQPEIRIRRGARPIAEVATSVAEDLEQGDDSTAWRRLVQFTDDFRDSGLAAQRELVSRPPAMTGERRFDAAIAGLVEFLSAESERPHPGWTEEGGRFAEPWWFVSGLPGYEAMALRDTPVGLARHGVFVNEGAFASV
jgi:transcriptional regulator with XRE-family HTH domain